MKRKKLLSFVLASAFVLTTAFGSGLQAYAQENSKPVKAEASYENNYKNDASNTIGGKIKIKNTSSDVLNLKDLKIEYYFSADDDKELFFDCDYAGVSKGNYQNLTSNVTGSIKTTEEADKTKKNVIEITFTEGSINAGEEIEVNYRMHKSDWSSFDQTNDYSFTKGVVVNGNDSGGGDTPVNPEIKKPEIEKTEYEFDKNKPEDITIAVKFNDNTLKALKDGSRELEKEKDYKESADSITVLKDYLTNLDKGTKKLNFVFSDGTEKTVSFKIKDSGSEDPVKPVDPQNPVDPVDPSAKNEIVTNPVQDNGKYNYGEALQKALMFYEYQISGKMPDYVRNNWRSDSAMEDGKDAGLDLTGGLYDAGDYVKFNQPMAWTSATLAWSLDSDRDAYEKSGQTQYAENTIKIVNDYLMKCHPDENTFYVQVGDPSKDHNWWGPAEVMKGDRPSYKATKENGSTSITAESAASLASAAVVFKDSDPDYADKCISHAKSLFDLAVAMNGDKINGNGTDITNGCYKSTNFGDELSWAAVWLYKATGEKSYLDKAEEYADKWEKQQQTDTWGYKWTYCWENVQYGAQLLLAEITGKDEYKESVERNLDYWTTGYNDERVAYTPKGLAWLDQWGSLRYASNTAFIAGQWLDSGLCTESRKADYKSFLESQIDYALGSTGRSFVVGFGENPPKNVHHRGASGSWGDSKSMPPYARHILYGALAGGPSNDDGYKDDMENYTNNEVADDYNAGFTGALVKLYKEYGGNPIEGLNDIEVKTNNEFFVEASVNASSTNFVEIKGVLYNESGWPAINGDKLSFNYYVDLSEIYDQGYSASDIKISTNYSAGAKVSDLKPYDEANHIYYVTADYTGTDIYPGGQSAYRKEVQFRLAAPDGVKWDNSNDYSYEEIAKTPGAAPQFTNKIPVYNDGKLVFGAEPGV